MTGEPTESGLAALAEQQEALRTQAAKIMGYEAEDLADWNIRYIDSETSSIFADVPLEQLDVRDVPTEPKNVDNVIDLLDDEAEEVGGTGQRDPAVVCHVPGDGLYITDGFHRHAAQSARRERDKGDPELEQFRSSLFVHVQPNKSRADVVSQRIAYARNHKGVRFARILSWMQGDWEDTEWAAEVPSLLTALRALSDDYWHESSEEEIAQIEALTEEKLEGMKTHLEGRCADWKYSPTEIQDDFAKADGFNPDLLQYIYVKQGATPKGRLSMGHVELLAEEFKEAYGEHPELVHEIQAILADVIKEHQLTKEQSRKLIGEIEEVIYEPKQLQKALETIDIDKIKKVPKSTGANSNRNGVTRSPSSSKTSSSSSSTSPQDMSDGDLLFVVSNRLNQMQRAAVAGVWRSSEARLAMEALEGLAVIVTALALQEKATRGTNGALQKGIGAVTMQLMRATGMQATTSKANGGASLEQRTAPTGDFDTQTRATFSAFLNGSFGKKMPMVLPRHEPILSDLLSNPQEDWSEARVGQLKTAVLKFKSEQD